jgi:DNA-binding NarL/FixJ family response regulator
MAARLFISERAVELRRQRLMQRLGVRSVPELLELAITHRVLSELRAARQSVG